MEEFADYQMRLKQARKEMRSYQISSVLTAKILTGKTFSQKATDLGNEHYVTPEDIYDREKSRLLKILRKMAPPDPDKLFRESQKRKPK